MAAYRALPELFANCL